MTCKVSTWPRNRPSSSSMCRARSTTRVGRAEQPWRGGNVARLLAAWRAAEAPIIHVRHREPDPDPEWHFFHEGDPGFEFKPEAMPVGDEPVITKGVNSAFIGTDLEERLRAAGATTVVIAAIATDHCGSTTARMSGNLGFETWFVGDACATFDRVGPDGEVFRRLDPPHESRQPPRRFADVVSTDEAIREAGLGLGPLVSTLRGRARFVCISCRAACRP